MDNNLDKCEPVAWQFFKDGLWWYGNQDEYHKQKTVEAWLPIRNLYTSPQPIEKCEPVAQAIRERDRLGFAVVNVIGKLDEIIENTQEVEIDDFLHIAISIDMWNELQAALEDMPKRADLYTSPQPRDWVSLSDDDIRDVFRKFGWTANRVDFEDARAIEAKLKQLNTKG